MKLIQKWIHLLLIFNARNILIATARTKSQKLVGKWRAKQETLQIRCPRRSYFIKLPVMLWSRRLDLLARIRFRPFGASGGACESRLSRAQQNRWSAFLAVAVASPAFIFSWPKLCFVTNMLGSDDRPDESCRTCATAAFRFPSRI